MPTALRLAKRIKVVACILWRMQIVRLTSGGTASMLHGAMQMASAEGTLSPHDTLGLWRAGGVSSPSTVVIALPARVLHPFG